MTTKASSDRPARKKNPMIRLKLRFSPLLSIRSYSGLSLEVRMGKSMPGMKKGNGNRPWNSKPQRHLSPRTMNKAFSILLALFLPAALSHGEEPTVSFENDVLPILTRAGCMAGACHAKSDGQ